jgi:hypothetical protein
VRDVLRKANHTDFKSLLDKATKVTPFPAQLYALAVARQGFSKFRDDIYLNSPNILSLHQYLSQDPQAYVVLCISYDIVANEIGVRDASGADPFTIRLEQGILDTNAEALITAGCGKLENTAEIFAQTNSQPTNWVTLRSLRDDNWGSVQLPGDVRSRIRGDLAAGYTVVVPEKPIAREGRMLSGWWRVNPRTGQTLGMASQGWGSASSEFLLMIAVAVGTIASIACIWKSNQEGDVGREVFCIVGGVVCAVGVLAVLWLGVISFAVAEVAGALAFTHTAEVMCAIMGAAGGIAGDLPRGRAAEPPK